jgi:hypothetical protein
VCCLAEFLKHAPCLNEITADINNCALKLIQNIGEIIDDVFMKTVNKIRLQEDSELQTVCW